MNSTRTRLIFIYANQFGYHTDSHKYCEHLRDSFDITYFCFDRGLDRINLPGINVIYMPFNNGKIRRLINFYFKIIKYTKKAEIDIIFTIQFKFCFLIGLFAKARIKVLDYRTGDLSVNAFERKLKNIFLWFDSLFFHKITVISEGLRDILHLSKTNTFILPLGGDSFSKKRHSYEHLDLLYVGSFNLRNIHQTIEGVAIFLSKHPEKSSILSYIIIGFGVTNDEYKIMKTIEDFNLKDIVHFIGRKSYTELPVYFDSCNFGVSYLPIKPYYEHQPVTKTFEYSNSGLFTIATSTNENCKVISDRNGILCEDSPNEFAIALEHICIIKNRINENEIRSSLKNFTWVEIINGILKPYLLNLLTQ